MPQIIEDGDRKVIEVGAFQLVFGWADDRWGHTLHHDPAVISPRFNTAISIENVGRRDDPTRVVSPTYQDLHFQKAGMVVRAFLVGQSGPHHFSAVFEVEERIRPDLPGWPYPEIAREALIRVEVADRCREPVEALSATYATDADSSDVVDASPTSIVWDLGRHRLTFATDSAGPTRLALAELGRQATQVQALAHLDPSARTHQFQYNWRWDPDIRW